MLALILGLALAGEAPRELLRWDRAGIADFELWRLVSGHFVHLDNPAGFNAELEKFLAGLPAHAG